MNTPNSEEIRQRLNKLPLTKAEIIRQTGVPQTWLYEFAKGQYKTANYDWTRKLEDFVNKHEVS